MLCRSLFEVKLRPLFALMCGLASPCLSWAAPHAEWVGSFVWHEESPLFGGFSGFETDADGRSFLAVTDSAATVSGRLDRGADGAVVSVWAERPLLLTSVHDVPYQDHVADSEGLALLPDGRFAVSFETWDRVTVFPSPASQPSLEVWTQALVHFPTNAGAEALATAPDGSLIFLPERPLRAGGDFPVFRMDPRTGALAQSFRLRHDESWSAVGADFDADGRLYLLERDYWPLIGFRTRVRRITLTAGAEGAMSVAQDVVLFSTPAGRHDNLEGIAVWRDAEGGTRLTMISDDNFLPTQRTEIVDYRVVE
ncbi:MAG: esterase-like activity of phytase family protein [Rhodobacteraceae bacterium]|nr:esterase-like activity of phytase family protein [Paracoccaceae bacterium]